MYASSCVGSRLRSCLGPKPVDTHFDLILAASENDALHELGAPILLVSHGMGYQKYYRDTQVVAGLNPAKLVFGGKIVPEIVALSHWEQRDHLRASTPEAVDRAVVISDPCLDRMLLSKHRATDYRAALGAQDKTLIVLASTWGPQSLFGSHPDLAARLTAELAADEYQVCAIMHRGITSAHSPYQLNGWLSAAQRAGLRVLPPEMGWRARDVRGTPAAADLRPVGPSRARH